LYRLSLFSTSISILSTKRYKHEFSTTAIWWCAAGEEDMKSKEIKRIGMVERGVGIRGKFGGKFVGGKAASIAFLVRLYSTIREIGTLL